jgi:hypothetical protein
MCKILESSVSTGSKLRKNQKTWVRWKQQHHGVALAELQRAELEYITKLQKKG